MNNAIKERLGLGKEVEAVVGTRNIGKADIPETFEVVANGKRLWCDPVDKVPLSQRFFLF